MSVIKLHLNWCCRGGDCCFFCVTFVIISVFSSVVLENALAAGIIAGGANPQKPTVNCDVALRELNDIGPLKTSKLWGGSKPDVTPVQPLNGPICGENSCCGPNVEYLMVTETRRNIDRFLTDSISKLAQVIDFRAKKFDEFFRGMMNTSKIDFHNMFTKIYGKIYLQNAEVFSDFFDQLDRYYRLGTVRLADTIEQFFGILYERMFVVINRQRTFDDKYLVCVSEHMVEMQPFGDVPSKLTKQLRHSFVATRTYHRALLKSATIVTRMRTLKLDEECAKSAARMQFCGRCRGEHRMGTCSPYCIRVMEHCLRQFTVLSHLWDHLIESLDKVADRLLGGYNIEMVVESLNTKISDAIMNFQESGDEVTKKIYSKCGSPKVMSTRRKRQIPSEEYNTAFSTATPSVQQQQHRTRNRKRINTSGNRRSQNHNNGAEDGEDNPRYEIKYQPYNFAKTKGRKRKKIATKKVFVEESEGSALEQLIRSIKVKVGEARQFWLHLPYQYCNNATITAPPSTDSAKCWAGNLTRNLPNHHPINMSSIVLPVLLREQIASLEILTDKLRKAYQGDEVDFMDDDDNSDDDIVGGGRKSTTDDDDENDDDGSGSGSGGGSIDFHDDDDDDNSETTVSTEVPSPRTVSPGATSTSTENVAPSSSTTFSTSTAASTMRSSITTTIPSTNTTKMSTISSTTRRPTVRPEVIQVFRSSSGGSSSGTSSTATPSPQKMSLARALTQYIMPIVLVWFGGTISELL